jgi:3'(2'), 5'-bisphosphate nucleotidase
LQGRVGSVDKADGSPVTEADRNADLLIRGGLRAAFPADAILSEETADDPSRLSNRRLWLVDPIDGTKGFIEGNDEWAVQVALAIDGVLALGVLGAADGSTWWGIPGLGAGCISGGVARPVSAQAGPAVLLTSHREQDASPLLRRLDGWQHVRCHSVGHKVVRMLSGRGGVYVHRRPLDEWDVAAPAAVISAAGGRALGPDGSELRFNSSTGKCPGIACGVRDELLRLIPA